MFSFFYCFQGKKRRYIFVKNDKKFINKKIKIDKMHNKMIKFFNFELN